MKAITMISTRLGRLGLGPVAVAPEPRERGGAAAAARSGAHERVSSNAIVAVATTNQIDQATTTEPRPSSTTPMATAPRHP